MDIQNINDLLYKGNYEKAKELIVAELEQNPDDIKLQGCLGQCLYFLGLYDEALKIFKNLVKKNSEDSDSLIYIAKIYIAKQEYEEAEKLLKKILELDENDIAVYGNLAPIYAVQNKGELLNDIADKVIEINSKNSDIYKILSSCLLFNENYKKAKKIIDIGLKQNPEDNQLQRYLGRCFYHLRLYDKALKVLKNLVNKNNEDIFYLADTYFKKKEYKKVEKYCKQLIETGEYTVAGYKWLALAYAKQKQMELLSSVVEKIIKLTPNNYTTNKFLISCFMIAGNYEKAKELIVEELEQYPEDIEFQNMLYNCNDSLYGVDLLLNLFAFCVFLLIFIHYFAFMSVKIFYTILFTLPGIILSFRY